MATKLDLMGLGLPAALANIQGGGARVVTAGAGGSSALNGSATQIGPNDYIVIAATGTSSVALPAIGGPTGCLLGDEFTIVNATAAAINVFALPNPAGTAVTIIASGASQTGTTGTIVSTLTAALFVAYTSTAWGGLKNS